jgi:hypothetical protein
MCRDIDASTRILGTFFCFVLIAYIFYYLGSSSFHVETNAHTTAPCDRLCCRPEDLPTPGKKEGVENGKRETLLMTERELEVKRILEELVEEAKRVEIKMKISMAEWNDKRKLEMKGWREEQIRWLWGGKQKEEKGILGWFGARGRK